MGASLPASFSLLLPPPTQPPGLSYRDLEVHGHACMWSWQESCGEGGNGNFHSFFPISCPAWNMKQNKTKQKTKCPWSKHLCVQIAVSEARQGIGAQGLGAFEEQKGLTARWHSLVHPLIFICTDAGPLFVIRGGKADLWKANVPSAA